MGVLVRFLPYIGALAALIGAVLYIRADARADLRAEIERAAAAQIAVIRRDQAKIEARYIERLAELDTAERTITNNITREVRTDARYSSPDCSLSASVLRGVNEAREATSTPGGNSDPVPAP